MRSIGTVFRKEVLEGLRDRRAMLTALLFGPMFGPILFAGITNYAVSIQLDEAEKPIEVPVVGGADARNLMAHLHRRLFDVDHDAFPDLGTLRGSVRRGDTDVGLVVDAGFRSALRDGSPARLWIVTDVSNNTARTAVSRLRSALLEYGSIIGTHRLQLRGIDPTVARPIAVLTEDVSTPSGRAILLLGMMTYFLLFATLIGGTQVAIDTTAGERERGSLEPLLTLPAARASVVWGKLGATFFFMAVSLGVCIVAFAFSVRFLPLAKIGMTANFTPEVCIVMYVVMLPFAALGAGVMTIVASYTKTFREAQTYTGLAMVAPTLPIVLVVLNPVQATLGSMLVPSLAQHLLVTELVKGEGVEALHVLVSALATTAVGLVCGLATVRRYGSERLLV